MPHHNYFFFPLMVLILHQSYWLVVDCNCGDVNIGYPFVLKGSKHHSNVNDNFILTCVAKSSNNFKPKAVLSKFNLEVIGLDWIDYYNGYMTVKLPVAKSCAVDNNRSSSSASLNLMGSPFYIDTTANVFASVGCDGNASLYTGNESVSCNSRCNIGSGQEMSVDGSGCNGYYCCQSDLRLVKPFQRYTVNVSMRGNDHKSCRTGFLTSRSSLQLNYSIAQATSAQSAAVPVVLQWTTPDYTAGPLQSDVVVLVLLCLLICSPIPAAASCIWCFWLCKTSRKREEAKLKAKYFKTRLEEEWSSDMDVAKKTKLFRMKDLMKATNNFDKERILGQGGQGTVYKGMLINGQLVAVKKSKEFDERFWKQFINEVILLSKINHRNVVKLLGCCLETKKPMLVYEFIPNGTLFDYIHKSERVFITWEMRIRIASEIAGAFSYLHSSLSTPIYHRDIKSTNILLDENYRAKVADFGISRVVSTYQTHMTTDVQGTFGYFDPEYYRSSRYSEKSEVYSFGVILAELLTRQHPIRVLTTSTEDGEDRSLVFYFVSSMNESRLEEILDPIVLEESKIDEIMIVADMAKRCLNARGMDRPTMKEVATELEGLKKRISSTSNANVVQQATSLEIESVTNHDSMIQMVSHAHTAPIILHKDANSTVGNQEDEEPLCRDTW